MIEQALACVAAPSVSMQVLGAELQVSLDIDVSSCRLRKTMIITFMSWHNHHHAQHLLGSLLRSQSVYMVARHLRVGAFNLSISQAVNINASI